MTAVELPTTARLLSLPELAAAWGVNLATIYRHIERNEFPLRLVRIGRSVRVRLTDVEAYLAAQTEA